MPSKANQQKAEHIDRAAALVAERLEPETAQVVERFLREYTRVVAPHDLLESTPDNLYGAIYSLWKFSAERRPGKPKIRAYSPRVEEHGWKSPHTIIEIVNDDMPFLVDSVTAELARQGLEVHLAVHPIVCVRRTKKGERLEVLPPDSREEGALAESMMHVEVNEQTDPAVLDSIVAGLKKVLSDVRVVVNDWKPMLGRLREATKALDEAPASTPEEYRDEVRAFLEWLAADHFTLLGYRDYDFDGGDGAEAIAIVPDSGLGLLRNPDTHVLRDTKGLSAASPEVLQFMRDPEVIIIVTKANVRSTVHRPVYLDYIGLKRFDAKGNVIGERRFVGLFTSVAYNESARVIPFLRRRVAVTLERAGLDARSHDGKALVHILETFPRDELFQISDDDLFETAMGILQLQERPRIRLFARRDTFGRFASCLVFVPRERFTTELRKRFEEILAKAYNGHITAFYTQLGDSVLARLHLIVGMRPAEGLSPDVQAVEQELIAGARSWHDDLHDTLIERHGEEGGLYLWSRYEDAFSPSYREAYNDQMAVFDIAQLESLEQPDDLAMNLYRPIEEPDDLVHFKLYRPAEPATLSDCLPMLEKAGFRVLSETPHRVARDGGANVAWVQDFRMQDATGAAVDLGAVKDKFQDVFARLWRGEIENDGFNRLTLRAGLEWREVVLLRAFARYLRQIGITYSQQYMEETLANNPAIARLVVALFCARFDPALEGDRKALAAGIEEEINQALEGVDVLDEDRILRRFLNLVEAALRTSYYQRDEAGALRGYVAFKFDCAKLAELPLPRPFAEIFVYSPQVEGVHLRGGKVARGGIRWSDRREDFRTEVLGLMKAQMVKNAVIVPVGAKGGFVPKRLPASGDRDAVMQEGIACYKIFIGALLDLTDNLSGNEVVPPVEVMRYDADDPYLVVAADKGTASFSDIANGLAVERGFWLGDAFASGGSSGYDHKKMGITARGAWESVKRHFRELDMDIQNQAFTVVGIGDMSGDVFGNGMLLSRHIRLLAAFDHRNVFIDPDPDPAKSWEERKRMFELPRSSWADYDSSLISKGGGVYDRKAKSVAVSPEARKALGLGRERYTPSELINALLKAPVDLLWFGGIGTYVKSRDESHAEVGDRTNDAVRVNGGELRCKVIGEGGNLGLTQLGRVEFGRAGGRLNTDAVDNSAGVDCSDHEVNIKILLGAVVGEGEMTDKQRDRLLEEMTDEVAELVLRDNYLQTQALTLAQALAPSQLEQHARFMRDLERGRRLDRNVEYLPDDEQLAEMLADNAGLTRPELAVLLAYAKMTLFEDLVNSDVPEDSYLANDLIRYFPLPLQKKHLEALHGHRLRREIIATYVANSMVNRVGITFVHDVMSETGKPLDDVARAYALAREVFDLREVWQAIEELDNKVPAALQTDMLLAARDLVDHATDWFLDNVHPPIDTDAMIEMFKPGVAALGEKLGELLGELDRKALQRKRDKLKKQGVPEATAYRVAALEPLMAACDIVLAARQCEKEVEEVARVYFGLGSKLGLDWLRARAETIKAEDHWERLAISAIVEDLFGQQRALTNVVLAKADGASGEKAIHRWAQANRAAVERSDAMIGEFRSSGVVDVARLAIANRQIRALIAGG